MTESGVSLLTRGRHRSLAVLMATYNGSKYIRLQLESIAAQTLLPDELLIGDDGSSDDTIAIVEAFALRVSFPVRVIRNPVRLGYGQNFLNLATSTGADLLAFSDQDDVWLPSKLERCVAQFSEEQVVFVAHATKLIDADGSEIGDFRQGIYQSSILAALALEPWGVFYGFSTLISAATLHIIPSSRRFPEGVTDKWLDAHDRWTYFLANTCGRTAVLAEPLALYRQHGSNLYGAGRGMNYSMFRQSLADIKKDTILYMAIARHRIALCQEIALLPEMSSCVQQVQRASEIWRMIEARLKFRLTCYEANGFLRRGMRMLDAYWHGAYRDPLSDRVKSRPIFKDLVALFK